jgi:flavin reductase (DIM6/NTAB) family NADH-FMN oxidoreductase RutF
MKLLYVPCEDAAADPTCRSVLDALGPGVEVIEAVPAGAPRAEPGAALDDLVERTVRQLDGAPYAVYGCGTGGRTGYAWALALVTAGHRHPAHLFASADPGRCDPDDGAGPTGFEEHHDGRRTRSPRLGCPVTVVPGDGVPGAEEGDRTVSWSELVAGPVTPLRPVGAEGASREVRVRSIADRMRTVLLAEAGPPSAATVTGDSFREAMAQVAAPVTVVTTRSADGRPRAFTASAVCSLSADPPLLLVCVNRSGSAHEVFTTADRFLVNVLSHEQAHVARAFARHERAEAEAGLVPLEGGVPGLREVSARFLCTRQDVLPGGDHSILVGRLTGVTLSGATPLLHYQRTWHRPVELSADLPVDRRSALVNGHR